MADVVTDAHARVSRGGGADQRRGGGEEAGEPAPGVLAAGDGLNRFGTFRGQPTR